MPIRNSKHGGGILVAQKLLETILAKYRKLCLSSVKKHVQRADCIAWAISRSTPLLYLDKLIDFIDLKHILHISLHRLCYLQLEISLSGLP